MSDDPSRDSQKAGRLSLTWEHAIFTRTSSSSGVYFNFRHTSKGDCWNLCLIFTFWLVSSLLVWISYKSTHSWKGISPLLPLPRHFPVLCLFKKLGPQVLVALTVYVFIFYLSKPLVSMELCWLCCPLAFGLIVLHQSLRMDTFPESNVACSRGALLDEIFISESPDQVLAAEKLHHFWTDWVCVCVYKWIPFPIVLTGSARLSSSITVKSGSLRLLWKLLTNFN